MVTGWGRITNHIGLAYKHLLEYNVPERVLQKVKLPIVDSNCSNVQFCAGGQKGEKYWFGQIKRLVHNHCSQSVKYTYIGENVCKGDSGGPVVIREASDSPWYQVGIVSYGNSVCGTLEPAVFTKVTSFLPWIESKLEE